MISPNCNCEQFLTLISETKRQEAILLACQEACEAELLFIKNGKSTDASRLQSYAQSLKSLVGYLQSSVLPFDVEKEGYMKLLKMIDRGSMDNVSYISRYKMNH